MKVRIKGDISGSRNGVPWPKRGETIELPDDEAAAMCASGLAVPVAGDESEAGVPDDADVEKRPGGLTKVTAEAVIPDRPDDQEQTDSGDGDQAAPAKKTAAPAKKTTVKRTQTKPSEDK